jgi:heme-degrading monooxygenase HmoA
MTKYVYIWEYKVNFNFINEFERHYNSQGSWVKLFKKANGYIETHFFKDKTEINRYVTVDYWESYEAYKTFREKFSFQFDELDNKCEQYTIKENKIGDFILIE